MTKSKVMLKPKSMNNHAAEIPFQYPPIYISKIVTLMKQNLTRIKQVYHLERRIKALYREHAKLIRSHIMIRLEITQLTMLYNKNVPYKSDVIKLIGDWNNKLELNRVNINELKNRYDNIIREKNQLLNIVK